VITVEMTVPAEVPMVEIFVSLKRYTVLGDERGLPGLALARVLFDFLS